MNKCSGLVTTITLRRLRPVDSNGLTGNSPAMPIGLEGSRTMRVALRIVPSSSHPLATGTTSDAMRPILACARFAGRAKEARITENLRLFLPPYSLDVYDVLEVEGQAFPWLGALLYKTTAKPPSGDVTSQLRPSKSQASASSGIGADWPEEKPVLNSTRLCTWNSLNISFLHSEI